MVFGVILTTLLALQATPEQRAVEYLSGEVATWSRENQCFSCHNNGDAARTLFIASRRGYRVPPDAVAETKAWLLEPQKWASGKANPVFSDLKLAHIQFAAALAEMEPVPQETLIAAARLLLPFQHFDGSWQVDPASSAGSPVTYGTALATQIAQGVLKRAGDERFDEAVARATGWFSGLKPRSLLDLAVLFTEGHASVAPILKSQSSDGGWGPYPGAPSEPFDTAVAMLALHDAPASSVPISRARAYLLNSQLPNGGWLETTRPPGSKSYAQHVSTSAWATLALLMTNPKR